MHFLFKVQKCQEGYRLHENTCVSLNVSERCLEPEANFYHDNFSVAQMYKPVVGVFIDKNAWERFEAGTLTVNTMTQTLLSRSISCKAITLEVYQKTVHIDSENEVVCRLFYFEALSFTGKLVPQMNLYSLHKNIPQFIFVFDNEVISTKWCMEIFCRSTIY